MKRKILIATLLLVCLLGLGLVVRQGRAQYEYKLINMKLDGKTEGKLNELGAQGWELVTYDGYISNGTGADAGTFMLKRQK